jgi:hypothetical protein
MQLQDMERRVLAQEGELHRVLAEARRNAVIETNRLQALHAEVLIDHTTLTHLTSHAAKVLQHV